MDTKKIESLIYQLLEALGEDPNRDGLLETPKRVAQMMEEEYMKAFSIQMLKLQKCMVKPSL